MDEKTGGEGERKGPSGIRMSGFEEESPVVRRAVRLLIVLRLDETLRFEKLRTEEDWL